METKDSIYLIEIEKVRPNPYQPRANFDEVTLRELAESIKEYGILEPLIVSRKEIYGEAGIEIFYELIAGERRLEAAKLIGLRTVPAIIKIVSEKGKLEIALIENLQRRDLNPIEKAKGFAKLLDEFRLTQREIAYKLGKSREYITNTLRLLKLPEKIQSAIMKGELSESQARLLLSIEDISIQDQLFDEIVAERLTIRESQKRLKRKAAEKNKETEPVAEIEAEVNEIITGENYYDEIEQKFEEVLGTKVKLQKTTDGLKLEINLYSEDELQNILNNLNSAKKQENNVISEEDAILLGLDMKKLDIFEEEKQENLESFEQLLDK
jgi:ParB family chromosome partitioning protein